MKNHQNSVRIKVKEKVKLYHGSNIEVKNPQILESDRKLDFGTGFYLTTSYEQAEKWLRFISANRKNQPVKNDYDIVVGPVANDRTMPVISLFFTGVYTEEETIRRLLPQKLQDQIVFKTEKLLQYLKFVESIKNDKGNGIFHIFD